MSADRKQRLQSMRLYVVLTEQYCKRPWLETAELLLQGGANAVQLREKALEGGELLARARALRELTNRFSALFFINDRPDIAVLSGADGVHVGQEDLPPEDVRGMVGAGMLIGLSTHSPEQATAAQQRGADYVGIGPVFATATKGYAEGGGARLLRRTCRATALPTVAIGGITVDNVHSVIETGVQAVAACAGLCGAEEPQDAARAFLQAFE